MAMSAGLLVVLAGLGGLLWSLGWLSLDVAAMTIAVTTFAPWTGELTSRVQMVIVAALLLSSALVLWWWVEGEAA